MTDSAPTTALPEAPACDDVATTAEQAAPGYDVFISYRIEGDHSLAVAVRELIEGSLDPAPRVFVASGGGLRPSSKSFKPQIQQAAASAKVFVAIITQNSKSREWLFFEAGAAWVRDQVYAPLLVDTSPGDLSSTIADYQATKALDREQMKVLVAVIAEALACDVKTRFGPRFIRFERRVERHLSPDDEDTPKHEQVRQLITEGKRDEAEQILCAMEEEAPDGEARAWVRISHLLFDSDDVLAELKRLPERTLKTATGQYWIAQHESNTRRKIDYLNKAIALAPPDSMYANWARVALARNWYNIGERQRGMELLRDSIRGNSPTLRAQAIQTWLDLNSGADPMLRVLLACAALQEEPKSKTLLEVVAEDAIKAKWHRLAVYARRRLISMEPKNASLLNSLGILYDDLNLPSLAYRAYKEAANNGVSVAKVNMARLHSAGSVQAAGLDIVLEHDDEFDAEERNYPYDVRGQLEAAIQKEQGRSDASRDHGFEVFRVLSAFAEAAIALGREPGADTFQGPDGAAIRAMDNALQLSFGAQKTPLERMDPDFPLWHADGMLVYVGDESAVQCVLDLTDEGKVPHVVRFDKHVPQHESSEVDEPVAEEPASLHEAVSAHHANEEVQQGAE